MLAVSQHCRLLSQMSIKLDAFFFCIGAHAFFQITRCKTCSHGNTGRVALGGGSPERWPIQCASTLAGQRAVRRARRVPQTGGNRSVAWGCLRFCKCARARTAVDWRWSTTRGTVRARPRSKGPFRPSLLARKFATGTRGGRREFSYPARLNVGYVRRAALQSALQDAIGEKCTRSRSFLGPRRTPAEWNVDC